jgi:hypothetical protein
VIDEPTQRVLQEILRRESRSLLQYLSESFPWTTPDHQAAVAELNRLAGEERQGAGWVADFLRRHHVAPAYLGPFPMDFTNINFIGLDYAVLLLRRDVRGALAALESDLPKLHDEGARKLVRELITVKQCHEKDLQALATDLPAATRR